MLPVTWMGAGLLLAACRRRGRLAVRRSVPDLAFAISRLPLVGEVPLATAVAVRPRRLFARRRRHRADADRARPPVGAQRCGPRARRRSRPDGTDALGGHRHLTASGVWLLLRPRTYPGHHRPVAALLCRQPVHLQHGPPRASDAPPVLDGAVPANPADYTDPVPQALVLDGHRHRLCHDGAFPGRSAGVARPDRQRPRRRPGSRADELVSASARSSRSCCRWRRAPPCC